MNLSVNIDKSGPLLRGKAPAIVQGHIDRFLDMVTQFLSVEVKKRTPQGVYGAQGGLISTIGGDVPGKGTPLAKGIVFHGSLHGDVIEKGRAAGKAWPPEGVLLRWIEVKMGLSGAEAKRVEFLIRRKIGQRGFEGYHMFEKSLMENETRIMSMADGEKLAAGIVRDLNGE